MHDCADVYFALRYAGTQRSAEFRQCAFDWLMVKYGSRAEFSMEIIERRSGEHELRFPEPCPLCRGRDLRCCHLEDDEDGLPTYFIGCAPCRFGGPRTAGQERRAWEAWNERKAGSRYALSPRMRGFRGQPEYAVSGEELSETLASPCPFCGTIPSWAEDYTLWCFYCHAGLWTEKMELLEALRRWNRRAPSAGIATP